MTLLKKTKKRHIYHIWFDFKISQDCMLISSVFILKSSCNCALISLSKNITLSLLFRWVYLLVKFVTHLSFAFAPHPARRRVMHIGTIEQTGTLKLNPWIWSWKKQEKLSSDEKIFYGQLIFLAYLAGEFPKDVHCVSAAHLNCQYVEWNPSLGEEDGFISAETIAINRLWLSGSAESN